MVSPLFDTNILTDLRGVSQARAELRRYRKKAMSNVTWMEVLVGVEPQVAGLTRAFLAKSELLNLDETMAECAVELGHQTPRERETRM